MVRNTMEYPAQVTECLESRLPGKQAGFTLVEVIIAMVILAFGLMGMAGTTAIVVRQTTLADVVTERSAALQTTIERLRAAPFDSVGTGADSVGIFYVKWYVEASTSQWKSVRIITVGPGMSQGVGGFPALRGAVSDTFTYWVLNP